MLYFIKFRMIPNTHFMGPCKGLSRNELITGGGWVGLTKDED